MKLGYVLIYVHDVKNVMNFYQTAFGLKIRSIDPAGSYGELDTGDTILAFASHTLARNNFGEQYQPADLNGKPFGFKLAFLTSDVSEAYSRALTAGAASISEPSKKPWGQTVGYVRAVDGTIIELCTEMGRV